MNVGPINSQKMAPLYREYINDRSPYQKHRNESDKPSDVQDMIKAIKENDDDAVRKFIDQGMYLERTEDRTENGPYHRTFLLTAIFHSHFGISEMLIDGGANVNGKNVSGVVQLTNTLSAMQLNRDVDTEITPLQYALFGNCEHRGTRDKIFYEDMIYDEFPSSDKAAWMIFRTERLISKLIQAGASPACLTSDRIGGLKNTLQLEDSEENCERLGTNYKFAKGCYFQIKMNLQAMTTRNLAAVAFQYLFGEEANLYFCELDSASPEDFLTKP